MAIILGSTTYLASHFKYYIEWTEDQINSTNNTSRVTASVYIQKIGSYSVESSQNDHDLYIDGTHFSDNNYVDMNPETTPRLLVSGSKTITHNSNGTKSITISSSGEVCHIDPRPYYTPYSGSASASVSLTTITRATQVSTTSASSVAGTSATVGGNVTDAGIPVCTQRGIYWGTSSSSQPNKITSGSGGGIFSANITGLERGTTYYFKAFSYNSSGYHYGNVLSFTTTSSAPSITTGSASGIDTTSATVSGNVTNDNGATVTERGICYNTSGNPTISSSKVTTGSGEGTFSENLTGLTPDTTYYAKAYATNSLGTTYGTEIQFDTLVAIPTVTTDETVTSITTTGATLSGEVVSDNGSTITQRGFVYSNESNPTIANSIAVVTGTIGEISKALTGLSIGTTYYFKAFATNSEGTGYGDEYSFTTLPGNPSGLSANTTDKTAISLTWNKGSGGTYTIIRRGTTPPANIESGTLVYNGVGTSFIDTGLSAGTHYYYRAWSATTSDWSMAYSSSYSASDDTTMYNFTDTANALADDSNWATIPTNDGKLYAQISTDNGSHWSPLKELTFNASITTTSFGLGSGEKWGYVVLTGDDTDDGHLLVKIIGGSENKSYQIFKNFGIAINDSYKINGIEVQVKAAYDSTNIDLFFVKVNAYYGTSAIPVKAGSMVYDDTLERPTYYDGTQWMPVGGGSKVLVSETAITEPKFGDIWVDVSS